MDVDEEGAHSLSEESEDDENDLEEVKALKVLMWFSVLLFQVFYSRFTSTLPGSLSISQESPAI